MAFLKALQAQSRSMDGQEMFSSNVWRTIKYSTCLLSRRVAVFAAIWHSITDRDRIHRLAGKRPRHISTSPSQPRRRHN